MEKIKYSSHMGDFTYDLSRKSSYNKIYFVTGKDNESSESFDSSKKSGAGYKDYYYSLSNTFKPRTNAPKEYDLHKISALAEPAFITHQYRITRNENYLKYERIPGTRYWRSVIAPYSRSESDVVTTNLQSNISLSEKRFFEPGFNFPGYNKCAFSFNEQVGNVDVNALLAYAERRKTYRLIGGNARNIANAWDALRSGNAKQAGNFLGIRNHKSKYKNLVRNLGPRWLELTYGWRPLVNEIYGALVVLDNLAPVSFFVKSVGHTTIDTPAPYTGKAEYTITLKAKATVTSPTQFKLQQSGILNPFEFAWELLPYSFVFDWFLPVGSFLRQLTARAGLSFTDWSQTFTKTESWEYESEPELPVSSEIVSPLAHGGSMVTINKYVGSKEKGKFFSKQKKRILTPVPEIVPPQLQSPLSLHHAITSVALIESRRK